MSSDLRSARLKATVVLTSLTMAIVSVLVLNGLHPFAVFGLGAEWHERVAHDERGVVASFLVLAVELAGTLAATLAFWWLVLGRVAARAEASARDDAR